MTFAFDTEYSWTTGSAWDSSVTWPAADSDIGTAGDGVTIHGSQNTTAVNYSFINASYNHAAGGGGKGFRFHAGNGSNDASARPSIDWGTLETELWFRFYARFQTGFDWDRPDGVPTWIKFWDMRSPILIWGHYDRNVAAGRGWGWNVGNATNWGGDKNWNDTMGDGTDGQLGDGLWHCFEGHYKTETTPGSSGDGQLHTWVDDVLVLSETSVSMPGDNGHSSADFWINVSNVENGDFFVDIDDIRISNTARVGPLGAAAPSVSVGSFSLR